MSDSKGSSFTPASCEAHLVPHPGFSLKGIERIAAVVEAHLIHDC
jgi:hypothetical protein